MGRGVRKHTTAMPLNNEMASLDAGRPVWNDIVEKGLIAIQGGCTCVRLYLRHHYEQVLTRDQDQVISPTTMDSHQHSTASETQLPAADGYTTPPQASSPRPKPGPKQAPHDHGHTRVTKPMYPGQ